ncbi:cytochrome P450 [Rhodocollybia butyracea]|uniref:Cytochrome P450 n=1 Tax=Rhodocollybia butyracea TaxID=206335 RepID=A0A9P5Q6T6_9AGAR|nr:cytochrome P450 [Rhodocollybia butyracea]
MIPPGPVLLFRLAFPQALSVLGTYTVLNILTHHGHSFSKYITCLVLIIAFLSRLIWSLFLSRLYAKILDTRRATQMGAVLPPLVEGSSSEVVAGVVRSFGDGYVGEAFVEWAQKYGNIFMYQVYTQTRVMTLEPEHVKAILTTQFDSFEKGVVNYQQLKSLLGSGVFNSDGDMWKFHRKMTLPFFSRNRISDFDIFEHHTEDTISIIKTRLAQGYPIEFQSLIGRFTLDSATEFLFGKDVGSLSAGIPYPKNALIKDDPSLSGHPSNMFVRAFMEGQEKAAQRGRLGDFWPLAEFWSDKVKAHRAQVDNFTNPIVEERRRAHLAQENTGETGNNDDGEGQTFLDHLIRSTDDDRVVKDELCNILVAGRDATASLLTFAIYKLTERPDLTKKLRTEILEFIGPHAQPSYKHIADMKYLRAFLNETLRLYPAVGFNSRYTKKPIVLPAKNGQPDYYIPAGVKCVYSPFLMHRREDLWGPDALEFDPDRFIDERVQKYLAPSPYLFTPFSKGPRICVGKQFAYNEVSYFLIRLLQSFTDFEMDWDAQPESSKSPADWVPMPGTTKGRDKVMLTVHLTMMVKVYDIFLIFCAEVSERYVAGRAMGQNERIGH